MPDVKWTPAQAAAIADRGGTLLVSAAAGSGKTAVLAERAVGLITDPVHPAEADRLLIVTFTNAAAAELRARIAGRLAEEVKKQPGSARLRRQRMLLQRAPICTIDAFCLDLLRRHFSAMDIPPDFSPADAGSLRALRDEALAETMEQAVQSADFCAFADLYGKGRSDMAAGEAIGQVYDFLQALPDPEAALARFLQPWQAADGFPDTLWHRTLCDRVRRASQALSAALEKALAGCRADCEQAAIEAMAARKTPAAQQTAAAKAKEKFGERLQRLEELLAFYRQAAALSAPEPGADAAANWQALCALLAPYRDGSAQPGFKGLRKRPAGPNEDMVKAVADQAAAQCEKLLDWVPAGLEELEADRRAAAPLLAALGAAVQDFSARYYAKKLEKKLLDFSDFEHLALKLLQNPDGSRTALCARISAGFDAVMVDEYQDTNALQDALYTCLARPAGDNLFFVGDIKQSIYRFRQAEPAVFAAREQSYPLLPGPARPAVDVPGPPARIALDANFRSAPAVVEGINYLFGRLMSPGLGGVVYGPGQRLVCGTGGDYAGGVEAAVLAAKDTAVEARWVARRIRALVEAGTPVRGKNGTRPLAYEDCCILLAARARFTAYSEALAAEGIPVYADSAEDLLQSPPIRPLIALLRIIDNPARNIELAAAMRSALFGFSDDDLLRLRAAAGRCSLYGALVAAAESESTEPFALRCRAFYARLGVLRRLARSLPVDALLEEIFASTGYLAAVGAGPNGARRRDEVRRFAAWAAGSGAAGLPALIRAIDATAAAGGLPDAAPGKSRPGCVSIMTIHRSKGLQFPLVVLADTAHKFNLDDMRRPVLLHRELGLGLSLRGPAGWYPTAARAAIQEQIRQEALSEQMRLLYVALTRAQDLLLITLPLENPERAVERAAGALAAGLGDAALGRASSFADWLLAALLVHPDAGVLRRASAAAGTETAAALPAAKTASRITVRLEQAQDLPEAAAPSAVHPAEPAGTPDPAAVAAIRASFAWEYPALAETRIPAKVSVTSIVHRSEATRLERPGFLARDGLTAAEKGTALHAFLERADFAALAAAQDRGPEALARAVEAEVQRQLAWQLAVPETLEKLDRAQVLTFLQGEAFARVRAAGRVYREYDFITGLPAGAVLAAQQNGEVPAGPLPAQAAGAAVLVQGIADLVLEFDDHLELLDYKTDRGKREADFLAAYRAQLNLYAQAIEKRFAPKKVTYKGIYSFVLGRLIRA